MYIIGFNGSTRTRSDASYTKLDQYAHNSAAVLLKDGVVVAAIEEERLDRMKHSHKAPLASILLCLRQADIVVDDVAYFAYYFSEEGYDRAVSEEYLLAASCGVAPPRATNGRATLARLLSEGLGQSVPVEKIEFVQHQLCHAFSAFSQSGFERCLFVTLDGWGEREAGWIGTVEPHRKVTLLRTVSHSLGLFYLRTIAFLGYYHFDEYKVMGLAPYGDRARFRHVFAGMYRLLDAGDFEIGDIEGALRPLLLPRLKHEAIVQVHKDLAAALQEALEVILLHVLRHFRAQTGATRLCMAGGVALNCAVNLKIMESGLFEDIFIQPAAHDAGCALGAALATDAKYDDRAYLPQRCRSVYWGSSMGSDSEITNELALWHEFVDVETPECIVSRTAALLADGNVIGWIQGRSEFGPRALGNRSILADPRPSQNRDKVNQIIKQRDGYRPFAPSVTLEDMREYFEVPAPVAELPFMLFLCKVKAPFNLALGAVTHVDGTARVQSVDREVNERYWRLHKAFETRTGLPILLNTSFNNNWEPIVDSVQDAMCCYLSTGLDYLVIGDFLIRSKTNGKVNLIQLAPHLPWYMSLVESVSPNDCGTLWPSYQLSTAHAGRFMAKPHLPISPHAWAVLRLADGGRTLAECLELAGVQHIAERESVTEELLQMWHQRRIQMLPANSKSRLGFGP